MSKANCVLLSSGVRCLVYAIRFSYFQVPVTKHYSIAVIAGDGIGQETIPVGCDVLRTAQAAVGGFELQFDEFPWGTEYYMEHGSMMPAQALEVLAGYDAIYLGAIGFPSLLADHITLWGLLLPIRKRFEQYINLRPCRLLPGVRSPLRDKGPEDIDFICVRENSEGEYAGIGGRTISGRRLRSLCKRVCLPALPWNGSFATVLIWPANGARRRRSQA